MKVLFAVLVFAIINGCKIITPVVHNIPKEKNALQFPKRIIHKGDSAFYFWESSIKNSITEKVRVDEKVIDPAGVGLDAFTHLHHTLSFMIIRNDSILYENYANDITDSLTVSSFSVAKSFVSTLVGMAIEAGDIKSCSQSVTDFIPELKDKGFAPVTIAHLLKHTSGIHFTKQSINPNSDNAQFYYGKDLRTRMLNMQIEEPPGLHFNYQSENYHLLGLVIERATHKTLSEYLQDKLWVPLGMEHNAFWSMDNNTSSGIEKAFCCLNATTRDFAKLGRLYLNNGNWNGKQLISAKWIYEATHPDTTCGGKFNFQYNWITGPEKYGSYYATGLYGQYIYLYPQKNVIIVRFGKEDLKYDPAYWKTVFLQIIDQL